MLESSATSKLAVSVVIATLGGDSLAKTIEHLNSGAAVPSEILICIPEAEASCVGDLAASNVKIIPTPVRGQVAQRAYGFQRVVQEMVLQLDDDILLRAQDIRELVNALVRLGHGNAVAPIYRDPATGHCLHAYHRGVAAWLQSAYAFLICAAPWGMRRMGVISEAGVNYGVDDHFLDTDCLETQWLPGGCVLCYRNELITENFYPYAGKAYGEDVVHSILRRKRGVRLWVLKQAQCITPAASATVRWTALRAEIRIRHHIVHLNGGKIWRLYFWCIADIPKRLIISLVSRIQTMRLGRNLKVTP
jgi:hypothetical protein